MDAVLIFHNLLRWAVLLFGVITVISGLSGVATKRAYTSGDNKSNLFFMISCDIQLLLGLVLYFSNHWMQMLDMKNPYTRFFGMEHGVMMILAWIFVHVGRATVKKAVTPAAKHKRTLIWFGLALVIILAAIPWPFREAIARPFYRWF